MTGDVEGGSARSAHDSARDFCLPRRDAFVILAIASLVFHPLEKGVHHVRASCASRRLVFVMLLGLSLPGTPLGADGNPTDPHDSSVAPPSPIQDTYGPSQSGRLMPGSGALDFNEIQRRAIGDQGGRLLFGADQYATSFVGRLSLDYRNQIQFPFGYAKRHPTRSLLGVAGIATLVLTDHVTYEILVPRDRLEEHGLVGPSARLSKWGNGSSALPLVLGIGALGIVLDSPRERETSLMLVEAVLTSATWTQLLKQVTGRERPHEREERVADWEGPALFNDEPRGGKGLQSFPSGHSTGVWAAATILASQYPTHGIVPILAFGTASAMSYSRMVVGAHWLSDVVVGGLIGYGCARQILSAHEDERSQGHKPRPRLGIDVTGGYRGVSVRYDF